MSDEEVKHADTYWRLSEWFSDIDSKDIDKLRRYHAELIFFNGRMNLISPRTEVNADLIHFADGIMGAKNVMANTRSKEVYDIGSGNGVPGIILALLYPSIKVTLLDSDARKVEFLKHVTSRLELKNIQTTHARLEDLTEGTIRCGVSRGFASISKALLASRRAAADGSEYFHFKGPAWSKELAEIPAQILAHWEPERVIDYSLPAAGGTHTIVLTRRKMAAPL